MRGSLRFPTCAIWVVVLLACGPGDGGARGRVVKLVEAHVGRVIDDRRFLVFMDSTRIVAAFDHLHEHGVFAGPLPTQGYARDSVRFLVRDHGTFPTGRPYRELVWVAEQES